MIIAHDLGTSANKATIHNDKGEILYTTQVSYTVNYGTHGESEQNPQDWWNAVVQATRELVSKVNSHKIEAICVSGQMMGVVPIDKTGHVIRPALIWSDQRATKQAQAFNQQVGAEKIYKITGHRVGPTYNVCKLMWLKQNEPENYRQIAYTLVAKDYVNYKLTGKIVTDHTDASHTGVYDLSTRTWNEELIAAANLDFHIFPPIIESTAVIGTLIPQVANVIGLPTHTKVVIGGGDGPIATVGAGCTSPNSKIYACLGTSAWFACCTKKPIWDSQQRSFTFAHVIPGLYVPTATTQNGSGVFSWLANILEPTQGNAALDALINEAATLKIGDSPNFLPYLLGERSPWWTPYSRGAFLGLDRHHTRAHLMRAAIEGVAHNLALCLETVAANRNIYHEGVEVIGGGARNDQILQIYANVWGVPVYRRTITNSANSIGAAVTGLYALGKTTLEAANSVSQVDKIFTPEEDATVYKQQREQFIHGFKQIKPWDNTYFA